MIIDAEFIVWMPFTMTNFTLTVASLGTLGFSADLSTSGSALPVVIYALPTLSTQWIVLPPLSSSATLTASVIAIPILKFNVELHKPEAHPEQPAVTVVSNITVAASGSDRPPLVF